MNSSNYQANHFIELAEEIRSGEISLKDLYYCQLITDINHLDDAEFTDVEVDFDNIDQEENISNFLPLVNFEFTKNVMSQVRQIAKEKQLAQQPVNQISQENITNKGFYGFNIPKIQAEPDYKYVDSSNSYSGIKTTNQNAYQQSFYSVIDQSLNSNQNSCKINHQATKNNINSSTVVAQNQTNAFFNKSNMLVAFIAFTLTIITASLINIYKNNDSGFSTLASNSASIQHVAMKKVLEQTPTTLASNNLNHQNYTLNFGTTPINQGIKLIGFTKITAVNSGLVLESKQAANLSILFSNFEIQKRLAK